jgi:hypothetical protein
MLQLDKVQDYSLCRVSCNRLTRVQSLGALHRTYEVTANDGLECPSNSLALV